MHLHRLQEAAPHSTRDPVAPPCNPNNPEACSACGVVRLAFEPEAVFCTCCGLRIKKNQVGVLLCAKLGNWAALGRVSFVSLHLGGSLSLS